jgi:hypothetical protein
VRVVELTSVVLGPPGYVRRTGMHRPPYKTRDGCVAIERFAAVEGARRPLQDLDLRDAAIFM